MKTQRLLGILFLVLGLVIMAPSIVPALLALTEHPPRVVPMSVIPLSIGIVLALFGALMIPFSGADVAAKKLTVILATTSLPFVGKGNAPQVTATVTTETTEPAPPKDGGG
jgi:hypothetical protein